MIAMTEVFVIRNQLGHYWGKSKAWVDGTQPRLVHRARHRDEAVNTLVELSSKDFELRGEVVAAEPGARGEPMIEPSQNPLPADPAADSTEEPGTATEAGVDENSPRSDAEQAEPAA